jgi:polysaccharide biosynthesis/export protein
LTKRLAARFAVGIVLFAGLILLSPSLMHSQGPQDRQNLPRGTTFETSEDFNRRLEQLRASLSHGELDPTASEYRIGTDDVLEVRVFDAPELNRTLRVSAAGSISTPLTGEVQAAGLSARQLEGSLESKLRAYVNDPHVDVFVVSVESHPVSVLGEVNKPGVFQIREPKTLLEMLSMAQGLADDAGDKVLVMRGSGLDPVSRSRRAAQGDSSSAVGGAVHSAVSEAADPSSALPPTITVDLKLLLDSGDPVYNVPVYPGDIIKVTKAGIVYVVGGVKKPGGFAMRSNEEMSLLKAIALAEGVNDTAAKSRARIIHTDEITGQRSETPVDLGKILAGKLPDMRLKPADIVFVPRSNVKSALFKGTETAVATASGVIIFHP